MLGCWSLPSTLLSLPRKHEQAEAFAYLLVGYAKAKLIPSCQDAPIDALPSHQVPLNLLHAPPCSW